MNRNALRLLLVAGALVPALTALAAPAGAVSVPIDPKAGGVIGLCDQSLKPISHGSVDTTPFVWLAAGQSAAKGAWAKPGRTATLYAYQPRPEIPAAEWSGVQLTASGHYTEAAHPMDQATRADLSLANFIAEFPPRVDGLIELRLYLGGPDLPLYLTQYDATFIQVTGSTWSVVKGGTVSCTDGKSISPETVLLPSSVVNPKPTPSGSGTPTGTSALGKVGSAGASATSEAPASAGSGAPSQVAADRAAKSSSSSATGWLVGVIVLVAVLGLGTAFGYRRRRAR